jgi:hypothetical protein
MKFHGIDMEGPFVNEVLDVLPVFDPNRDSGRVVYLSTDDTLYLGTGTEWCAIVCGTGTLSNTADVMIRKFICDVDLTALGSHVIWTVGEDAMFLINTFEVITDEIDTPGVMPYVSFGVGDDVDIFVPAEQLNSDMNLLYRRQLWSKPHGAALEDTDIVFNVDVVGTSATHLAKVVVTGYLLPNDSIGPNIPYPAHNILFHAEEFSW